MKRWIWVLVMAPVMLGLFNLVRWADCLHSWQYSSEHSPPTAADHARAAIVFWSALLVPIIVGLATAVVAFRQKYPARWPIAESSVVGVVWLTFVAGAFCPLAENTWLSRLILGVLVSAHLVVGGVVVITLLNLGACARVRKWGRLALSALLFGGGMLYLLWLYAFIIYIDT